MGSSPTAGMRIGNQLWLFEPENGEQREYNQEYQLYRLQELQGIAAGVCKGIGKFYLCKIGDTYGYVHKSHMTK